MRRSSRQQILAAASALIRRAGGAALTLDAVADEAKLSKGGVLYHFPTKEALIAGLILAELDAFDAAIERRLIGVKRQAPGSFTRAYVEITFAGLGTANGAFGGLLAAIASDDKILGAYRARTVVWRRRMLADGLRTGMAETIRMAVDGLYFSASIGAAVPRGAALSALKRTLLSLTEPSA